ncbi:MAG: hypothetical protein ACOCTT_01295 [archaeon]
MTDKLIQGTDIDQSDKKILLDLLKRMFLSGTLLGVIVTPVLYLDTGKTLYLNLFLVLLLVLFVLILTNVILRRRIEK